MNAREPELPASSDQSLRWRWIAAIAGGGILGVLILTLLLSTGDSEGGGARIQLGGASAESSPPPTSGGAAVPPDFTGTWHTNFALVTLTQSGADVSGQYHRHTDNPPSQSVKGTVQGRTLTGKFDGRFDFAFTVADDGRTLDGYWVGADGLENEWCGTRDAAEQVVDCGYTGDWLVKGLPGGFEPKGDTISITQFDDQATVKFESGRYGAASWDADFDGVTLALATGQLTLGSGSDMRTYTLTFLVSEFKEWGAFTGTWRQTSPGGGQSGSWCGWRKGSPPPC